MRRTIAGFAWLCFSQIAAAASPSWEEVGRQALQQVNWDWRPDFEDWTIWFGPGRPGHRGLAESGLRRITIWVRSAETSDVVAGVIVHEIAHAFDFKYLTPVLRTEWIVARGLPPDTPWYFPVGPLSSDYLSGAGDFAEAVRWTLQGPASGFKSCLGLPDIQEQMVARGCRGLPPNEEQQALLRRWLAELPRAGGK